MAILNTLGKDSAHWYDVQGQPHHDADLRVARKQNLLPSVTSILSVWPKPALENYKIESAILASLTLPRIAGEGDDAFAKRVIVDMHAHRESAAVFGSALHKEAEDATLRFAEGEPEIIKEGPFRAWLEPLAGWLKENIVTVYACERVVVSKIHGYAGTYDLWALTKQWGLGLLDYKTQGVKKEPRFYDTWEYQLEAYARAIEEAVGSKLFDNLISVVIDSANPSPPAVRVWDPKLSDQRWRRFQACHTLWRESRNFYWNGRAPIVYDYQTPTL